MCLFAGPVARYSGGPWGQPRYLTKHESWSWAIEVAFPPFAFQLLLDGPTEAVAGVDLSPLVELGLDHRESYEFERILLGFGNSSRPFDYRTRGQIEGG